MEGQIELEDYLRSLNCEGFDICDYIPEGRANAVTRYELCMKTGFRDRQVRDLIHYARRDGSILNLSDGKGYFRPASVMDTGTNTMMLVYSGIKEGSLTIHLQNHYDRPFDRIRVGNKTYGVDFSRKLRTKQVYVVSEVM